MTKLIRTYMEKLLQPGNFVITTNWDLHLERCAAHFGVPLRYRIGQHPDRQVTLLKLHGSIDWAYQWDVLWQTSGDPNYPHVDDFELKWPATDYATLGELIFSRVRKRRSPRFLDFDENQQPAALRDPIVRIRVHKYWSEAWRRVKSRAQEPLMLTMGYGKTEGSEGIQQVWRDAYLAVSRARRLEVVGYSLPDDDIEIRTLLVAGLKRGRQNAKVLVRNPAPDVHERFHSHVDRRIDSDYMAV